MNHPPTIFVVEDDDAARESLGALVESMGLPSESYASASAFLERFNAGRRGCLITDLRMDGIDGLELQEKLNALGSLLPVIVVTGHASVPIAVRAMRGGALTLLEKPYSPEELAASVRQALELENQLRGQRAWFEEFERQFSTLTNSERSIVGHVAAGKLPKLMALELDVSIRTIERWRTRIFEKMNVQSTPELAAKLARAERFIAERSEASREAPAADHPTS